MDSQEGQEDRWKLEEDGLQNHTNDCIFYFFIFLFLFLHPSTNATLCPELYLVLKQI